MCLDEFVSRLENQRYIICMFWEELTDMEGAMRAKNQAIFLRTMSTETVGGGVKPKVLVENTIGLSPNCRILFGCTCFLCGIAFRPSRVFFTDCTRR